MSEDMQFRTLFLQAFGTDAVERALGKSFTVLQAFEFMMDHIPMPECYGHPHGPTIIYPAQPAKRSLSPFEAWRE